MSRQHVDFTTSANSPPNAPADDGLDTGETNNAAVRPINDGEPAQGAVFKRPSENLRTRSEISRDELEKLKYLSDADRALLLTSASSVTWAGIGGPGTFSLTGGSQTMVLKPFTAPDVSSASRLKICANTASQITIRTRQNGVSGQPRAYSGANKISFDFQPVDTGTGVVIITVTGSPADNFHVQFDSNAISGTTVQQMLNYLNNAIVTPGGTAFVAAGLEAVVDGTGGPTAGSLGPNGGPNEVGFPTPPAPIVANKVYLTLTVPEQATRYMSGAADAEKHHITQTHLTAFFTPDNYLLEGDVICVRYDDQVMPLDGGRRQSINEAPENKAAVAGANLFLMRRFPERLPGALPLATVVNGTLIFVNGRSFLAGETGPLVAAGASYQGSPAAPNSWADGTVVAGPVSFESALDTIIQTLGTKTGGSPGAIKVGFTPSGNIAANTVKGALEELDSEKASLALPNNTFTNSNTFAPTVAATPGLTATGNTTGQGVVGTGGATDGVGGRFTGGGTNGGGVEGIGKGTGGRGGYFVAENIVIAAVPGSEGVRGQGGTNTGAGAASGGIGVYGQGGDALIMGNAGPGGSFSGGANGGNGVVGQGFGTGCGVFGASGTSANAAGGIFSANGTPNGPGVYSVGKGLGEGVSGHGGLTANSYGVAGDSQNVSFGNGILGQGSGEGRGVTGLGGSNSVVSGYAGLGGYFVGGSGAYGGDGIRAEALVSGRSGVFGTSVGTGVGIWGAGGNASGHGVFGQGGSPNGIGVRGDGTGSGAGVQGYASATSNGVVGVTTGSGSAVYGLTLATNGVFGQAATTGMGVRGSGGVAGGYGVYGQAFAAGLAGVVGQGKGSGAGVQGFGDDTGVGTSTGVTPFGGYFIGGKGIVNTSYDSPPTNTSNGGLGALGIGGESHFNPGNSSFNAQYMGKGGDGVQGSGGRGHNGGYGVVGRGARGDGTSFGSQGVAGDGGIFFGGAGEDLTATLYSPGNGVLAIGGSYNISGGGILGGHGVVGHGGTSATKTGYAFYAGTGHIKLANATNPTNTESFINVLTGQNIVKAWGRIAFSGGVASVTVGFNMTVSMTGPTNRIAITYPGSGNGCLVVTDGGGGRVWSAGSGGGGYTEIFAYDYAGAAMDITIQTGTVHVIVMMSQTPGP